MKIFCQVVDSGSMAQAARLLDLAPATVTGAVFRIERNFGVRLLNRTTRKISTTEAGQIWYGYAKRILEESSEAEDAVRNLAVAPRGLLRVTLTAGIAQTFVYPNLQEFSTLYPFIEIELQINDRIVDLVENRFDLALRAGHLKNSNLIARQLIPYQRWTCVSRGYLLDKPIPQIPSDLVGHSCLTYRADNSTEHWDFWYDEKLVQIPVKGNFSSNDSMALLTWAKHGNGVLHLPSWYVMKEVQEGNLVQILADYIIKNPAMLPGIYAITARSGTRPPKLEVFLNFIEKKMRDCDV